MAQASVLHERLTDAKMLKGVGPQRAELLAKRGIHTLKDLLGYLPFRYEDRIHFSQIKASTPFTTCWCRIKTAFAPLQISSRRLSSKAATSPVNYSSFTAKSKWTGFALHGLRW